MCRQAAPSASFPRPEQASRIDGSRRIREVAGARALKDCQDSGRANCAVVFAECTDPYFVKY